jgi:hypothetical protein
MPYDSYSWIQRHHRYTTQIEQQARGWYLDAWRDRVATATGTRPSPYVDRANLPIPPKTTIELYKRTDPEHVKIWDTALQLYVRQI